MSIKSVIKSFAGLIFPPKVVKAEISTLAPNELLTGRKALITGGTSGIGFEIAKAFLNSGASVVITGCSQERLDSALNKICETNLEWKDRVFSVVMDVSNISYLEDCFVNVIQKQGGVDILVNNAGLEGGHINICSEEDFDKIINTNMKGVFFLSRIVAHYMIKNKIKGNILNICSSSSFRPANSAYTMSKWGIRGLTEGLARMLIPHGIVVNGIAPGMTATPMLKKNSYNDDLYLDVALTKRYAIPEEIANMAVVMVSNMCRMVVGDILCMTGGAGLVYHEDVNYNFE
ncbi:MAG: SDR family oxidoreductase [Treponema sp.]|nr:SDR family oxidoreductase [Treponema sp.]